MPHTEDMATRAMVESDLEIVSAIYAAHTGTVPPPAWRARVLPLLGSEDGRSVALVAEMAFPHGSGPHGSRPRGSRVVGYVVGEVRSWEFGSEPTGWIFGLSVDPSYQRRNIASHLLDAALAQLGRGGVRTVRTMVRRDDVAVLTFFRSSGFVAGAFIELERTIAEPEP